VETVRFGQHHEEFQDDMETFAAEKTIKPIREDIQLLFEDMSNGKDRNTSACLRPKDVTEDPTFQYCSIPQVELVTLLTDVAGVVREKSQFTHYMNYCYTVTNTSKRIVIEILPPRLNQNV